MAETHQPDLEAGGTDPGAARAPASSRPTPPEAESRSVLGAVAVLVAGLGGLAWFALELASPLLGFSDTDDPRVSLAFLREHPEPYQAMALVLIVTGLALAIGGIAASDALGPRTSSLTRRSLSTIAGIAAAFLLLHGVLRASGGPLQYIASLDADWGESAYLTVQLVGIHGVGQGGTLAACVWAIGVAVAGARSRSLPLWLCIAAVVPAIRLAGLVLGPVVPLPDGAWFVWTAAIPGAMLWIALLGVVLLVRAARARRDGMHSRVE